MHKGFVFDLGVWEDETVIDDPEQEKGLDLKTFRELLLSQYLQSGGNMVQISGFTPWNMKYTKTAGAMGQHGDVKAILEENDFAEVELRRDGGGIIRTAAAVNYNTKP